MAKRGKGKVLKVDSADKISAMEKLLGKGSVTFVLIYADWCGACTRFKKNIWNPACEDKAVHDRVALRDDMVGKTSLASANFDYLPSLIVVDENGKMQTFKTPEGKHTNAMPTPQSLEDMKTIVNVPVTPIEIQEESQEPMSQEISMQQEPMSEPMSMNQEPMSQALYMEPLRSPEPVSNTSMPASRVYTPTPLVAPMKGGKREMSKMFKGLSSLFKRSRKTRKDRKTRNDRKTRKVRKTSRKARKTRKQ